MDNLLLALMNQKDKKDQMASPVDYAMMKAMIERPPEASSPAPTQAPAPRPQRGRTQSWSIEVPVGGLDDRQALMQELNTAYEAEKGKRQEGIDRLNQYIQAEKAKEGQIDFSPLAAYVDSNFSTNLLKGYKAPETPEERQAKIMEMEKFLQDQQGKLADTEVDRLKAMMNAADERAKLRMMQSMARQDRFDESQLFKKEENIRKDLDKSVLEPLNEMELQYTKLGEALNSGDSQKIQNALSTYARSISGEKGVLTDQDIVRVLPRNFQADFARLESYFNSTPSAQIDPAFVKSMVEMIDMARNAAGQVYAQRLKAKRDSYGATSSYGGLMQEGFSGDKMFDVAEGRLSKFTQPTQPKGSAPVGGAKAMSFEEWKASRANR